MFVVLLSNSNPSAIIFTTESGPVFCLHTHPGVEYRLREWIGIKYHTSLFGKSLFLKDRTIIRRINRTMVETFVLIGVLL